MKKIFTLLLFLPCLAIAQSLTLEQVAGSPTFILSSPNFQDGQTLPTATACPEQSGSNSIPLLNWQNPPPGTATFAITVVDPDAKKAPWIHWFVYNIPKSATELNADALKLSTQGKNSWGNQSFQGPCPPSGKSHHYIFTLYALSQPLATAPLTTYSEFQYITQNNPGLVLSQSTMSGIFP